MKNRSQLASNLYIAELGTLAVMKGNTLFLRATFRDYFGLYVLNLQYFSLQELYEMTAARMSNLTKKLFQRALVFTDDIEDEDINHLSPGYNVTLKQIEKHFSKHVKAWNRREG